MSLGTITKQIGNSSVNNRRNQQIPKYTSFLKLFKDNSPIFKIYRNSSFTAASLRSHNTNIKKFSETHHKFISNMPLTQGLLSNSLWLI